MKRFDWLAYFGFGLVCTFGCGKVNIQDVLDEYCKERKEETPAPRPAPSPTATSTGNVTPSPSPEPTATPTAEDPLHKILVQPDFTTVATVCSRTAPIHLHEYNFARARVYANFPQFFVSEQCVKNGVEPVTGRSYRDLYSLAVAYFLREVGMQAIADPNDMSEIAVKSNFASESNEQYSTLEGDLSPLCGKVAIHVRSCSHSDCYRATCTPAWFIFLPPQVL